MAAPAPAEPEGDRTGNSEHPVGPLPTAGVAPTLKRGAYGVFLVKVRCVTPLGVETASTA